MLTVLEVKNAKPGKISISSQTGTAFFSMLHQAAKKNMAISFCHSGYRVNLCSWRIPGFVAGKSQDRTGGGAGNGEGREKPMRRKAKPRN